MTFWCKLRDNVGFLLILIFCTDVLVTLAYNKICKEYMYLMSLDFIDIFIRNYVTHIIQSFPQTHVTKSHVKHIHKQWNRNTFINIYPFNETERIFQTIWSNVLTNVLKDDFISAFGSLFTREKLHLPKKEAKLMTTMKWNGMSEKRDTLHKFVQM